MIRNFKTNAWKQFSLYIRLRDADSNGYVRCCSCGKIDHYKNMQAGHFIQGRGNSVLYNEKCVHAQCTRCNNWLKGNWENYYLFMQRRYGQPVIEELIRLKSVPMKVNHEEIYYIYKKKLEELNGCLDTKRNS